MANATRNRLRGVFSEVAELYQRARPDYPDQIFTDLVALAGVGKGTRVLEIGPGTGQATRPLLALHAKVCGIELGEEMARVARRHLPKDAAGEIVVADFESVPITATYDIVTAFTSWHWIDPSVAEDRAAGFLTDAGYLAIVSTHHVRDGSGGFFDEVQRCYQKFDGSTSPGFRLPLTSEITGESLQGERFDQIARRRYISESTYTSSSYIDLLRTYSGPHALGEKRREGLFCCIGTLIDDRFGGRISKRHVFELLLAKKRPLSPKA